MWSSFVAGNCHVSSQTEGKSLHPRNLLCVPFLQHCVFASMALSREAVKTDCIEITGLQPHISFLDLSCCLKMLLFSVYRVQMVLHIPGSHKFEADTVQQVLLWEGCFSLPGSAVFGFFTGLSDSSETVSELGEPLKQLSPSESVG